MIVRLVAHLMLQVLLSLLMAFYIARESNK